MGSPKDPPVFPMPDAWLSQISASGQIPVPALPLMWIAVTDRFREFHNNLLLTQVQRDDAMTKRAGVVSCLNSHYYGLSSGGANSFLVGSWGKDTMMRPPRDVDVYFLLPSSVYQRFQSYSYNPQAALLQEVKRVLANKYSSTDMCGDTHIILVRFGSFAVEVVPSFLTTTQGIYLICDSGGGGCYKDTAPGDEIAHVRNVDQACASNLRPLIRMAKTWQAVCNVPIKSFYLELIAADFLRAAQWRLNDWLYFDWIVRDFLYNLCNRVNGSITVPGTGEAIALGDAWHSRAYSAWLRAVKACEYEKHNYVEGAGEEWQKIFGSYIPLKP